MSGKKNPARFVSDGELQAIKRGISRELFESYEVVWMTVMRDRFGWGPDRLGRIMEDTHAVGEAMIDEKISVDSMIADLAYLRGVQVTPPDFIRRPIGRGEQYWTAADTSQTAGRMYRESDLRNMRITTEREVWQICEAIGLYTLQRGLTTAPKRNSPAPAPQEENNAPRAPENEKKKGCRDPFGTERLLRAQLAARALGEELAERRVSIADLRQVLLDEAHIMLQRPVPREKEIEKAAVASGGKVKMPFELPRMGTGGRPMVAPTGPARS